MARGECGWWMGGCCKGGRWAGQSGDGLVSTEASVFCTDMQHEPSLISLWTQLLLQSHRDTTTGLVTGKCVKTGGPGLGYTRCGNGHTQGVWTWFPGKMWLYCVCGYIPV